MTARSHERYFQITQLPNLRSVEKLDAASIERIWTSITNDEFYALVKYVSAFTDIKLKGYRQNEERGAFEACAKTLGCTRKGCRPDESIDGAYESCS
jgi:hypothetical protein